MCRYADRPVLPHQPQQRSHRPPSRAGQIGVAFDQPSGIALRQSPGAPSAVRHRRSEAWQPALRRADQIARAAHREVLLGDPEAVLGLAQDFQPPPAGLRQRRLVEQKAARGLAPPARPCREAGAAGRGRTISARSITMMTASGTSTPTSMTVVATRTCARPVAKSRHRGVPLGRGHLPMDQPDDVPERGAQMRVAIRRRRQVADLAVLDQGADPVCPPTLAIAWRRWSTTSSIRVAGDRSRSGSASARAVFRRGSRRPCRRIGSVPVTAGLALRS